MCESCLQSHKQSRLEQFDFSRGEVLEARVPSNALCALNNTQWSKLSGALYYGVSYSLSRPGTLNHVKQVHWMHFNIYVG